MHRTLCCALSWLILAAAVLLVSPSLAQTKAPQAVRRAQPPKFDAAATAQSPFYRDAFAEGLVGNRPANLGQAASVASTGNGPAAGGGSPATGGVAGSGWSAIISSATVEDMVKGLKLQVDQNVTTPTDFAGKGYKVARRDFSILAMLFAIAGEYESEVRWKKEAPLARDVFARTAANAKVGTPQVYQEAKLRKDELTDLLNGSNPYGGKEAEAAAVWKDVCGRSPLMQHLEAAWEPALKPLLSDKAKFAANRDEIVKHAEMLAAIGQVLSKPGMPDADDEEYAKFCNELRDGARGIADAIKLDNYDAAVAGSARITKSCIQCHESYR
ncbi:MAG: hypothetical protein MUF06_22865 [Pirellulaceae bacterium]|jgi:hypothetical protein|nr:hypothetical protein [Pirellulaceae bacterium]